MSDAKLTLTRRTLLSAGGLSLGAALVPGLVASAAAQSGGSTALAASPSSWSPAPSPPRRAGTA